MELAKIAVEKDEFSWEKTDLGEDPWAWMQEEEEYRPPMPPRFLPSFWPVVSLFGTIGLHLLFVLMQVCCAPHLAINQAQKPARPVLLCVLLAPHSSP